MKKLIAVILAVVMVAAVGYAAVGGFTAAPANDEENLAAPQDDAAEVNDPAPEPEVKPEVKIEAEPEVPEVEDVEDEADTADEEVMALAEEEPTPVEPRKTDADDAYKADAANDPANVWQATVAPNSTIDVDRNTTTTIDGVDSAIVSGTKEGALGDVVTFEFKGGELSGTVGIPGDD